MWVEEQGKALVVEDNPQTRAWLSSCVVSAFPGLIVQAAANLADAMILVGQWKFNLALVDLGLPDGSGMDVIRALHSTQSQCHVVVATIYDDDRNLFAALKSGAKGYILKDQDRARIVSYLQGIKKHQPAISAASSQRLINHFNLKADALAEANLTPREVEVLCAIGKGFRVEDTAGMLNLSIDTIKGNIKTIYTKLGVSNRSEVTLGAIRLGLIDVD